jgi:hypothetical protein
MNADRIGRLAGGMAKNAAPEVVATVGAELQKLAESGIAKHALFVGAKAPDFSDVLKRLQEAFGNPIPKFNGDDSWEPPTPGTFVIDRSGVVRLAHVDPDYTRRLEPADILDTLRGAGK